MQLTVSDHKPVSALFSVSIKVINRVKRQKMKEEIMKKLDMLENDFLPQVRMSLNIVIENQEIIIVSGDGGQDRGGV